MKFRADGRKIFKEPVQTDKADGKTTFSLGFPVCEVYDYITNADEIAQAIAEAMSQSEAFR